jgi:ribosomal protein S18 acetylase RimI-like enzyme
VIIRDVRSDEQELVGELRVAAYRALGLLPEGSGYADTLRGFGFGTDCEVLVAADSAGNILGTITLEPFEPSSELARDQTEADIRAFAVDPKAQEHGVGRQLLLALIKRAEKRGLRRLRLCTRPAMKAAQHLYETTGFARTPELDFEPLPGVDLQAYELALPLVSPSGHHPSREYAGPGMTVCAIPVAGQDVRAPLVLRTATAADIDGLLALWREAAENADRPVDTRAAVLALLGRDPEAVIVAERDGVLVGSVIAGWDGWRCHLYRLAVHPRHRGQGTGTALVKAAEDRFRSLGAGRADAMVHEGNDLGHGVWRALGYVPQENWRRWVKPLR